jgi:hypothetical protein
MKRLFTYLLFAIGLFAMNVQASTTDVTVSFLDDKGNTVEEYLNCSIGVFPYLIDLSFLSLGDYSVVISENENSYIVFFT